MKISRGTDYALHALSYLIHQENNCPTNVKELATFLNVSTSYLSKILTQLVKSGYILSINGSKGGYLLPENWVDITFLDVISSIEGHQKLISDSFNHGTECKIFSILSDAENEMNTLLKNRTLKELK